MIDFPPFPVGSFRSPATFSRTLRAERRIQKNHTPANGNFPQSRNFSAANFHVPVEVGLALGPLLRHEAPITIGGIEFHRASPVFFLTGLSFSYTRHVLRIALITRYVPC
jgi:hypothetical protein